MGRNKVVASEEQIIDMMVETLKRVPAKSLLLVELANKVPVVDGEFDKAALAKIQPQVNLAMAEAKSYGSATIMAVEALVAIPPKGGN